MCWVKHEMGIRDLERVKYHRRDWVKVCAFLDE